MSGAAAHQAGPLTSGMHSRERFSRAVEASEVRTHLDAGSRAVSDFGLEGLRVPRRRLRDGPIPPVVAYQMIHDELMLDGTRGFVAAWCYLWF